MRDSKRDRDVKNRLLDSVGEGESGMIWENSTETYIIICEIDRHSRFGAWDRVLRASALGWPWGMGWEGRWEGGWGWGKIILKKNEKKNNCFTILVSAVCQDESAVGTHMSPPSWTSLPSPTPSHPSRLSQSIQFESSLNLTWPQPLLLFLSLPPSPFLRFQ